MVQIISADRGDNHHEENWWGLASSEGVFQSVHPYTKSNTPDPVREKKGSFSMSERNESNGMSVAGRGGSWTVLQVNARLEEGAV